MDDQYGPMPPVFTSLSKLQVVQHASLRTITGFIKMSAPENLHSEENFLHVINWYLLS